VSIREEHRLRMFESRMLSRIVEPTKEDVMRG
jgi:hypothetical protein